MIRAAMRAAMRAVMHATMFATMPAKMLATIFAASRWGGPQNPAVHIPGGPSSMGSPSPTHT
eukprot:11413140-Prorocentrum_lima.AAC.1